MINIVNETEIRCPKCRKIFEPNDEVFLDIANTIIHKSCSMTPFNLKDSDVFNRVINKYDFFQNSRNDQYLNLTSEDLQNITMIQGPVGMIAKEELKDEKRAWGDIIEFTFVIIDERDNSSCPLKMFITTNEDNEFADKLSIRQFDILDTMMPLIGEYEAMILEFVQQFSDGETNPQLFDVMQTEEYLTANNFKEIFFYINKKPLKEHYGYDLKDDLEIVFYDA